MQVIYNGETCLKWFGHVQHRPLSVPVMVSFSMQVDGPFKKKGLAKEDIDGISEVRSIDVQPT